VVGEFRKIYPPLSLETYFLIEKLHNNSLFIAGDNFSNIVSVYEFKIKM